MWRRCWSSCGGPLKQTLSAINPTGLRSIIIVGNGSPAAASSISVYLRRALCDSAAAAVAAGGCDIGGGKAGGGGYYNSDSDSNGNGNNNDKDKDKNSAMSFAEARRLMRLVNVEALKRKLGMEGKEIIGYSELIQACESVGVARSKEEAAAFAQILDEAGVILLFRDKVYLHPNKVEISLYLYIYIYICDYLSMISDSALFLCLAFFNNQSDSNSGILFGIYSNMLSFFFLFFLVTESNLRVFFFFYVFLWGCL